MLFFTDFAKDADVSVGQCHHILLVSPYPVHHLLDCQLWSTGIKETGQSRMAYRCLIGIGPAAYIQFFGRHYVTEPARCNGILILFLRRLLWLPIPCRQPIEWKSGGARHLPERIVVYPVRNCYSAFYEKGHPDGSQRHCNAPWQVYTIAINNLYLLDAIHSSCLFLRVTFRSFNTSSKVWYCLCAKSASKSESACRANPI